MSMVFRKSVLGFNKDDVLSYINGLFEKINQIEQAGEAQKQELNQQLVEISSRLNEANTEIRDLAAENERLNNEIASFRQERDKLTELSEVIGKLYLVSKLNADSVIRSAKDMKNRTEEEIQKNLSVIEATQSVLNEMKDKVLATSDNYSESLNEVVGSLDEAKAVLESGHKAQQKAEKNMNALHAAAEASVKV